MSHLPPPPPYPIGTPGTPWGAAEKAAWLARQAVRRRYDAEVVAAAEGRRAGARRSCSRTACSTTRAWACPPTRCMRCAAATGNAGRPTVLVTGGVHGYETSGVQGALQWIATEFDRHADDGQPAGAALHQPLGLRDDQPLEPRRARPEPPVPRRQPRRRGRARDGLRRGARRRRSTCTSTCTRPPTPTTASSAPPRPRATARRSTSHAIPDGFYLVGDTERPAPDFQRALIDAVRRVTHIAEADEHGCLIGTPMDAARRHQLPQAHAGPVRRR